MIRINELVLTDQREYTKGLMLTGFKAGFGVVEVDEIFGMFKDLDGGYTVTVEDPEHILVYFALAKAAKSAYLHSLDQTLAVVRLKYCIQIIHE